jgi:eukaryotic-like serine/threonine-protein kinase
MSTPVTQVGPYAVERELGRGGMGVVLLGRDERLGRRVAIKSLAGDVASDPALLARFDREARLLASLNHPNIAGVYGVEERDGVRYMVMEFVEGRTLAERLRSGPLPIDEALAICAGVAAGVEAAHEAGVIHRDLKPGNVIVTPAGQPKVLDFGLAKASFEEQATGRRREGMGTPSGGADASRGSAPAAPSGAHGSSVPAVLHESPTLPIPASPALEAPTHSISTIPGRVLGTAGYMSPEQARGRQVDRRTDVWSLGCILFECLTGKSPFAADTVSDSIAAIIEREPAWTSLPPNTPPRVRELLARCLEKDTAKRLRDAGDAKLEIERALAGREWTASFIASQSAVNMPTPASKRAGLGRILAAMLVGAAIAAAALLAWQRTGASIDPGRSVVRLSLPIAPGIAASGVGATADERGVVYWGRELRNGMPRDETGRLYVRRFDESEAKPLPGTEMAGSWSLSPDGRWVAYQHGDTVGTTNTRIFKQPLDGSAPPTMVVDQSSGTPFGSIVWIEGGRIVVLRQGPERTAELYSVDTGDLLRTVRLQVSDELMNFSRPARLPGGDRLLAEWWRYTDRAYTCSAAVIDLATGHVTSVLDNAQSPRYSPTGHLVFTRADVILAARFDTESAKVIGPAFSVGTGLLAEGGTWAAGSFSLTPGGTLVHLPGGVTGDKRRVMVVRPDTGTIPLVDDPKVLDTGFIAITPSGDRAAVTVANSNGIFEVWWWEQGGQRFEKVFAEAGADNGAMLWSHDGSTLYVGRQGGSDGRDGVYTVNPRESQPPKLLLATPQASTFMIPTSLSADGRWLLGFATNGGGSDLFVADLRAPTPAAKIFPSGERWLSMPSLSPDGTLVCSMAVSAASGEFELARFSDGEISERLPLAGLLSNGRGMATWRDAKPPAAGELIYIGQDGSAMSVEVFKEPRLRIGTPRKLVMLERGWRAGAVYPLADGGLAFVQAGEDEVAPTSYAVTLNFDQEILAKERAAAGSGSGSASPR